MQTLLYLDVVVEGLVQLVVDVEVSVHGREGGHGEVLLGQGLQHADGGTGQQGTERQLVNHVREVGHGRIDVVVLGPHLDVEVARHSKQAKTMINDICTIVLQYQRTC